MWSMSTELSSNGNDSRMNPLVRFVIQCSRTLMSSINSTVTPGTKIVDMDEGRLGSSCMVGCVGLMSIGCDGGISVLSLSLIHI